MMRFLKRKHRGTGAGDIMATTVCMMAILVVFVVFVHYSKIIKVKESLDSMGREYLLILETTGELTAAQYDELQARVAEHFSDYTVTFNDNNALRKFGEEVSVQIRVSASWQELGITKVMELIQDRYEFNTKYTSISKAKVF